MLCASSASAQLADASARSTGLSGNDTATVQGFGAIGANPAGLAGPHSGFSLAIMPVRVSVRSEPIGVADLAEVVEDLQTLDVEDVVKGPWLERIRNSDGQHVKVAVDISPFALTVGNIGLQVSAMVYLDGMIPPEVAEVADAAIADDKAGAPVSPVTAEVRGYATTTAGLSFAYQLPILEEQLDVLTAGATVKYTVGNAVAIGRVTGSYDPVAGTANVTGSAVHTRVESESWQNFLDGQNGSGIGLDLGVMLLIDQISLGLAIHNVFNTFAWNEDRHIYRPIDVAASSMEEFDAGERPYTDAPAEARHLDDLRFKPSVRLGVAYAILEDLTVSADGRYRFGDGIAFEPQHHVGVGAEYRWLDNLHLRGGGALIPGGFQIGGGLSVILGPANLSVAIATILGQPGSVLGQIGLSFGNR